MVPPPEPLAEQQPAPCESPVRGTEPALPSDRRQLPASAGEDPTPSQVGPREGAATARSDRGSLVQALVGQIHVLHRENQRLRFDLAQLRANRDTRSIRDQWGCPAPAAQGEDD